MKPLHSITRGERGLSETFYEFSKKFFSLLRTLCRLELIVRCGIPVRFDNSRSVRPSKNRA